MATKLSIVQCTSTSATSTRLPTLLKAKGGGGSDNKDWGREKDEDEIGWIRRCLQKATRMIKPRKGKGLNR